MQHRLFIICLLFSLARLRADAQAYYYEHLNIETGLSNNNVYSMLQDSKGFMWIGTRDGLNRFDGYKCIVYKTEQGNPNSLLNNQINALYEDKTGHIWIGTHNGLCILDPATGLFKRFKPDPAQKGALNSGRIYCIYEDTDGDIWVGTDTKLEKYDPATGQFIHYEAPPVRADASDESRIHRIVAYNDELILAMWGAGVWRFNKKTGQMQRILSNNPQHNDRAWTSALTIDPGGHLWVVFNGFVCEYDPAQDLLIERYRPPLANMAENADAFFPLGNQVFLIGCGGAGLKFWNKESGQVNSSLPNPTPTGKSSNWISTIYQDKGGELWLGSADGAYHFNPNRSAFMTAPLLVPEQPPTAIKDLHAVMELDNGEIWCASKTYGIYVLDAQKKGFIPLSRRRGLPAPLYGKDVTALYQDKKGRIWVGTWGQGCMVWDMRSGDFAQFRYEGQYLPGSGRNFVSSIFEYHDGSIWLGTYNGAFQVKEEGAEPDFSRKFKLECVAALGCNQDYTGVLTEDDAGNIWAGALNAGLLCYNPASQAVRAYKHDPDDARTIGGKYFSFIFKDSKSRVWTGVSGDGLQLFDPKTDSFTKYRKKEGFPSDAVRGMVEDDHGILWVTTDRGLSKFDPESKQCLNFFKKNGLPCVNFAARAIWKSRKNGVLYAAGADGFTWFHPDSVRRYDFVPPVAISGLRKYAVVGGAMQAIEVPGISALDHIDLPYSENTLTFEFAAFDYRQPEKNQFAYRLIGFNPLWTTLGTAHEVTFSKLPPGDYTLQVKASNSDGVWNETGAEIQITIHAPWYRTTLAYTLYMLIVGGIFFTFYQLQRNRRLADAEAHRLKTLNQAKSEFISTVSHELRTPLTAIVGFSKLIKKRLEQQILPKIDTSDPKNEKVVGQMMENLSIVVGESERLTGLINELLDLSKIESGQSVWQEEMIQLDEVMEQGILATSTLFEQKKLTVYKHIDDNLPPVRADFDRLLQVVVNLLSNAVKFTDSGSITCTVKMQDPGTIQVGVLDTGEGIPEPYRRLVFEKFGQVSGPVRKGRPQGTGLGLYICKEIVEHYGGNIWVESNEPQGSAFYFTLPVTKP